MKRSTGDGPDADRLPEAVVLAGRRDGKSLREIAIDLYGAERGAAGWDCDGWMRTKVRRLVGRAGAESDGRPGIAGPGTQ